MFKCPLNCFISYYIVYPETRYKLELNQVAARRPAKAVAQFLYFYKKTVTSWLNEVIV